MKYIFELFFVADAGTAFQRGRIADEKDFEKNFYFIADTDREKYNFLNDFRYDFGQTILTPSFPNYDGAHPKTHTWN